MAVRKIASSAAYIAISTVALALMQWGIMAVIARVDGPEMLGYYSLAAAFAAPVGYIAWLSMRLQYLSARDADLSLEDCLFLRTSLQTVAFLSLLMFIVAFYKNATLTAISVGVLAIRFVEGLFDLIYGPLQRDGKARLVASTSVIRVAMSFATFCLFYIWINNLMLALIIIAAIWLVMFFWERQTLWPGISLREAFNLLQPGRVKRLRHTVKYLIGFGVGSIVMSFAVNIPRFLVEGALGASELGYFSASYHFLMIGSVAVGSITHGILPPLSKAVREQRWGSFWKIIAWAVLIMVLAALLGALLAWPLGGEIMRIAYGPQFAAHGDLLIWAACASAPVYAAQVLASGCVAARQSRGYLASQIATFAANVVFTLVFLPHFSTNAAYIGVFAGGVAQCAVALIVLQRFWRRRQA